MKLKQCIKIAEACGIQTLGNAISSIDRHGISIFGYDNVMDELRELYEECNALYKKGFASIDTPIKDVKLLIKE